MNPETFPVKQGVENNQPEAGFWTLVDLLIVPGVMTFFMAKYPGSITGNLTICGALLLSGPILMIIPDLIANRKNVISLYFDLFSGKFPRFSLIHKACLITLVIVDITGLLMITGFLLKKILT